MSLSHLVILGIIILIVVPPEKLPEIMRDIGRFINDLKRQTDGVFSEFTDDLKKDIKLTPDDMLKRLTETPRPPEEHLDPDKNSNPNKSKSDSNEQ